MKMSFGFSLVELIIVIGLTIFLVGLTATVGTQTIRNAEFDRVRETVRTELAAARADTIGGTLDSSWGVAFFSNALTRYRGTSYATRVTTYDHQTTFANGVTMTGTADVVLTRPYGLPLAPATININDGVHSATITVNIAGAIDVQ